MGYLKCSFVILLIICNIKGEDYEEVDYEGSNASTSVDSESNEVYNSSASSKPQRLPSKVNNTINSDGKQAKIKAIKNQLERKTSYPYSASIQKKNVHYASGALIDTKWILSAASEFYNIRESIKLLRARLGTVNYKKGGMLVALKGIEIHPLYKFMEPQYDVALLRLAQPVESSTHIKPIAIASPVGEIVSAKFFTTYWPRLIVNGKVLPISAKERVMHNSMRVSTQKLIPWRRCHKQMLAFNQTLEHSSLCLEPIVKLHSPCMPDVGAPVIADDLLWGITSGWLSENCPTKTSPILVTRLSDENVKFWLDSTRNI